MTKPGLPLDELYFEWLIERTEDRGERALTDHVFRLLHRTVFDDRIPNDNNRSFEGVALRDEFLATLSYEPYGVDDWLALDCSIFEMLVALSHRAEFQSGMHNGWWFSIFVDNLGLDTSPARADRILQRFNSRAYEPDGYGGLFPLRHPEEDQRDVEIWSQLMAYLVENDLY